MAKDTSPFVVGEYWLDKRRDGKAGNVWQIARYSAERSEEHTSELQSLMRISYAVICLKKKKTRIQNCNQHIITYYTYDSNTTYKNLPYKLISHQKGHNS